MEDFCFIENVTKYDNFVSKNDKNVNKIEQKFKI